MIWSFLVKNMRVYICILARITQIIEPSLWAQPHVTRSNITATHISLWTPQILQSLESDFTKGHRTETTVVSFGPHAQMLGKVLPSCVDAVHFTSYQSRFRVLNGLIRFRKDRFALGASEIDFHRRLQKPSIFPRRSLGQPMGAMALRI